MGRSEEVQGDKLEKTRKVREKAWGAGGDSEGKQEEEREEEGISKKMKTGVSPVFIRS